MKLDKIKFAAVVAYCARHIGPLGSIDIEALDELIDMPEPFAPPPSYANAGTVEDLMRCMVEGNEKIGAIKAYRHLTGLGLKESKDAVERYWVSKP